MYKTIFIAGINRSGGSLLARLFDGHKNLASYPLEIPFLHDNSFFKIFENYAGIPMTVPSKFDGNVSSISKHLYSIAKYNVLIKLIQFQYKSCRVEQV